ncbi:MAG: hypothetical protein ATN36_00780 [Epulopiscium sp. Nele67-Bin005]|nr:MAG: hypothetical protein ATN36_00780 [Epulopiscium sp. Nele67-Bin005]
MGAFGKVGQAMKNAVKRDVENRKELANQKNCHTAYEPDLVKVAEIENETKIQLSDKESERIELMKNAKLDILEFEVQSNLAIEQAKAQGLHSMAKTIMDLQEQLNDIAQKRLSIIEQGSLHIVRDIENFYTELTDKIKADEEEYTTNKLPKLLEILDTYEAGTSAHKLYVKRIEADMMAQSKNYMVQLNNLAGRQTQVIDGFMKSKYRIVDQVGLITANLIDNLPQRDAIIPKLATLEAQDFVTRENMTVIEI